MVGSAPPAGQPTSVERSKSEVLVILEGGPLLTVPRHPAKTFARAAVAAATVLLTGSAIAFASTAVASTGAHVQRQATQHVPPYVVKQVLIGSKLHHTFVAGGKVHTETLAGPDDVTRLGHVLYVGFQNGVGSQGEPSTDGNTFSTIVGFTASGHVVRQWNIKGKCDGLTADSFRHLLVATVNEDANSSIYTITPGAPAGKQIQHYRYNKPLPSKGGTDAISIYHGFVIVSASAPGTTGKPAPQPSYPALYLVTFNRATRIAKVTSLFSDEAPAVVANVPGKPKVVRLALTDPDSNEVVPHFAPRFGGDFMLTSQGDKEQIYVQKHSSHGTLLAVLRLSQAVDDTAWATSFSGRLYASDATSNTVDVVIGLFRLGAVFVAVTPCDANGAPSTCPGPGFPPNYLGMLNPFTGFISKVAVKGANLQPKGMIFVR
jgi:hypothetical protein